MVIFHSYVSLPEGTTVVHPKTSEFHQLQRLAHPASEVPEELLGSTDGSRLDAIVFLEFPEQLR